MDENAIDTKVSAKIVWGFKVEPCLCVPQWDFFFSFLDRPPNEIIGRMVERYIAPAVLMRGYISFYIETWSSASSSVR